MMIDGCWCLALFGLGLNRVISFKDNNNNNNLDVTRHIPCQIEWHFMYQYWPRDLQCYFWNLTKQ